MAIYTKKEVAQGLDVTPRTIQFYVDERLVIPEVDNPKGRGARRKYSRKNLFEFLLIKRLSDYGMTLKKIRQIIFSIHNEHFWDRQRDMPFKEDVQIIIYNPFENGLTMGLRESSDQVTLSLKPYKGALIVSLKDLLSKVSGL